MGFILSDLQRVQMQDTCSVALKRLTADMTVGIKKKKQLGVKAPINNFSVTVELWKDTVTV